jgi:hypothetical protein
VERKVFDQGSDLSNATFTAPVTGRYYLQAACFVTGTTLAEVIDLYFNTSNRQYSTQDTREKKNYSICIRLSTLADMDAADVFTVNAIVYGEAADTDDILGDASAGRTWMSGALIC